MKIKAAVVYEKGGPFTIEELDLDEPREDEVLVRVVGAGRFPFDRMIKFYPFDQINQAVQDSEKGRTLKAILRFGATV